MYPSLLLFCASCLVFANCSPVLLEDAPVPIEYQLTNPEEIHQIIRTRRAASPEPVPILDLFGVYGTRSHHHRPHHGGYGHGNYGHGGYGNEGYGHHGGHHGGGDGYYGNSGSFAGSSAQAGSFSNGGYGRPGSQSQANSNAASFAAGPFSASFSSSQANSGSNSLGGFGGYYRRK